MGIQDDHGEPEVPASFGIGPRPITDAEADAAFMASLQANTIRVIHPSVLSDARAELEQGDPARAHARLGEEAPDAVDTQTLHLAQRWHHIKAEAYLMQEIHTTAAVSHCRQALELGVAHGGEDPDQPLYTATLFCTFAEALRRAGQLDDETLEGLREFTAEILATERPDPRLVTLLAYAQRTLTLSEERFRTAVLAQELEYSPLSPLFTLPF